MTEKLTYEDGYVGEILVNKMNEIIDRLDAVEERLDSRFNSHWKYHRIKQEEIDAIKIKVGLKTEDEKNGGNTESQERKDTEKGKQRAKVDKG